MFQNEKRFQNEIFVFDFLVKTCFHGASTGSSVSPTSPTTSPHQHRSQTTAMDSYKKLSVNVDAKFGMIGENVHSVIFTSDTKPSTTQSRFAHVQRRSLQRSQLIVFFVFILAFSRSADFFCTLESFLAFSKVLVCFSFSLISSF